MAIIEADSKGKKSQLTVEIDRKTNATLKKYIRFSGADTDKIVAGALQRLFEQDEDFGPWLKEKDKKAQGRADRRAQKAGAT
jgi:hypothetical protein